MEYYQVSSCRLPTQVEENHKNSGQIWSVCNSDTSEKCSWLSLYLSHSC